jgi:hypothetical protein
MFYGEIYKIINNTNNKCYIGQAKKYVGKYDNEWGMHGRWKSHIYEAFNSKKDHCSYLNNAIRKYGKEGFNIEKVCECIDATEMNNKEIEYIQQFNTLVPNGYNLNSGGYSGKDSEETRLKKKKMRLGKKHTEQTKENISIGQIGNRRNKKVRKYEEDNNLPKYINCRRKETHKISYSIDNFPIGIKEKKYITKHFRIGKKNPEDVLHEAIVYLEELKQKYSTIKQDVDIYKNELQIKKPAITKKTEIQLTDLPKYIFPMYHSVMKNKIGYYVEGVLDNEDIPYPKKEFTSHKTNRWNLNDAKKYINECDVKNKDALFHIPSNFKPSRARKYDDEDNHLPKYVSIVRQKGLKIGYNIAIPSIIKENGKKYTRKFTNKQIPMKEKLRLCIETLTQVKNKYNIV